MRWLPLGTRGQFPQHAGGAEKYSTPPSPFILLWLHRPVLWAGPQFPCKLMGHELAQLVFFVPPTGTLGLFTTLFTYNGRVRAR